MRQPPLVGLPSDRKQIGHHPFQAVGEKYLRAVVDGAGCLPVMIPSLSPPLDLRAVLANLDGLLLTGAYSNIEPHHYSDEPSYPGNLHDPARDATALGIVPLAIELRVPVLALCRGCQEVNVALGGTLYQKVHEAPGFDDHRENPDDPLGVQYAPSHPIDLAPGGLLERIAGGPVAQVNSLHGQGLRTLGRGLVVEATARDGLVEAVRLDDPGPFLLAVQWHPEWRVGENPFYLGIFQAFAAACRERAKQRS
ncbi:MAG TPA: gamma-glutamyl-gamma-aminobutyrate hydrolase family protein [Arenimonas sp.]|uniref:gamma-glutamyl-gamma-aminobutyrate hydrolase family protein n=1 Tax=Arenimonas sp. TaxID=1872635 RepID=UPI002D7FFF95|nr:gamma-glutamyl-gamma-aminobutyrate hydrolase family protein [Arenimonas sp.]HEU0153836.1 gamma-glutamyl-gamma-aminobutyrate hydrolase family protein [Arenimonas sp.]